MPLSANKIMPCLHEGPGGERRIEKFHNSGTRGKGERAIYCIFTLKALHCGTRRGEALFVRQLSTMCVCFVRCTLA